MKRKSSYAWPTVADRQRRRRRIVWACAIGALVALLCVAVAVRVLRQEDSRVPPRKLSDAELAQEYVDGVVGRWDPIASRGNRKRWADLAKEVLARGDRVLDHFIPIFEALPEDERCKFLTSDTWLFGTKRGLNYLTSRLEGEPTWEKLWAAELLGQRRHEEAAPAIMKLYKRTRDQANDQDRWPTLDANPLAVTLVRLGYDVYVLDLLEQVEAEQGRSYPDAPSFIWELGGTAVRACVGPLIELYAVTPRQDQYSNHNVQARVLASELGLTGGRRVPDEESIALVDKWLLTPAAAAAKLKSYKYLAGLASRHERYAQASKYWRKAQALDRDDQDIMYRYGWALWRIARLEEALEQADAYVARVPDNPLGRALRGHVLLDQGNVEEAIAEYEAALRLDPRCGGALAGLHEIYTKQGRTEDAAAMMQRLEALTQPASSAGPP